MIQRARQIATGRLRSALAHPLLHPAALQELIAARRGGHPADPAHALHADEGLAWLERAQDASAGGGIARGYSLVRDAHLGWYGWQPDYPETTGYIIPTLHSAGRWLGRDDLSARALRAAQWEIDVQLPSGAVRGGVITQTPAPAVFNTGQVLFGWVAAAGSSGDARFAEAAERAGSFLTSALGDDPLWVHGRSPFARGGAELYNARTAWALAEAGAFLGERSFRRAAERVLETCMLRQRPNGWFPECCLNDARQPLLHTLAYATRGLLEGGRVLERSDFIDAAIRAARALRHAVRPDGWMPGRYHADWRPAVSWSCLTGQAQAVNIWLRLFVITGDREWLRPVPAVLDFLKRTQNRSTSNPGVHGGIMGAWPVSGGYGRYEVLSWATKFFIDALLRHDRVLAGEPADDTLSHLA